MLSIIILTCNSIKFIKPCLDSILSQDYKDSELIIVDNGSKDGTVDFIRQNYPGVRLIENRENLGAAKARNQGIEVSRGEWVLTLDCDVILERGFLGRIMDFVREPKNSIGIFQPKILNMDKKTIYSCGIYISWLKKFYDIGKGRVDNGEFNVSRYIFGACSAAALYRRDMLEEVKEETGYFDERFFFLAEDVDLALRAQKKNWKAAYYPEAVCYHLGNSSLLDKPARQFLCWRNRKFLLEKCRLDKFKLGIIYLLYDLPRLVFLLLTNTYVHNQIINQNNCNTNEVKD